MMAARGGYTSHGHPIPTVVQYPPERPKVARCGGPALCQVCSREVATMLAALEPFTGGAPQEALEPAGAPELPAPLRRALEASGESLVGVLAPWVAMVQDRDEVVALLTQRHMALQSSLAAVLAWLDRAGVRPNWANDVRTLEDARALLASLTPEAPHAAPTDPAR